MLRRSMLVTTTIAVAGARWRPVWRGTADGMAMHRTIDPHQSAVLFLGMHPAAQSHATASWEGCSAASGDMVAPSITGIM